MSNPSRPRGEFIPETHESAWAALMDLVRFGPEVLPNAEFLALLFHAERSVGWKKSSDAASMTQMTHGVYKRKTGERIRGGAGIKKATCAKANAALEKKGLIKRIRHHRENGGCDATEYEIRWANLVRIFRKRMPPTDAASCPSQGQYQPKHRQAPVHESDSPPAHNTDSPCSPGGQEQSRSEQSRSEQSRPKHQTSFFPHPLKENQNLPKPEDLPGVEGKTIIPVSAAHNEKQFNSQDLPLMADKWNAVVDNRPVDRIYPDTQRALEAAMRDEEFIERFDEICDACVRLNHSDKEYKFTWLFLTGGGMVNWKGVLRGKFDFAMPKPDPIAEFLARCERDEREQTANE